MANLVTPGYQRSVLINQILPHTEDRILDFRGINRKSVVAEGEMSDMWNLTAEKYPVLTPRRPRAEFDAPEGVKRPIHIVRRYGRVGLIAIDEDDNVSFYYNGQKIDQVDDLTTTSRVVAINTKLCFFPQKTYLAMRETESGVEIGEYAPLEASLTVSSLEFELTLDSVTVTLPKGHGLGYDDAIDISGSMSFTPSGGSPISMPCNVSCIIEDVIEGDTEDTIILPNETFIEATAAGASFVYVTGSIERTMPDLDMLVEWNNRLWGCSTADNCIYASKLGDPKNWNYFQGTSMDSFYAEQGTDEDFTGIAEYSGHIIFFKPNSMCRVYGTSPSNYQITNTKCYGVEDGSRNSVLTINDRVFYKSSIGIMAYDGGIPYCVSEKLGRQFKNVVAGTEGQKYYASCIEKDGRTWQGRLYVLDIEKALWHLEDDLRFTDTCKIDNSLYYTTVNADILVCDIDEYCEEDLMVGTENIEGEAGIINPLKPTENYADYDWMATFGPFDEYIEEHKIYSKLALRFKANGPAQAKVYMAIDEQDWELIQEYPEISTQGEYIPIIPRRADRYSVKIEGTGDVEIKSLTRRVRRGTFGRL